MPCDRGWTVDVVVVAAVGVVVVEVVDVVVAAAIVMSEIFCFWLTPSTSSGENLNEKSRVSFENVCYSC